MDRKRTAAMRYGIALAIAAVLIGVVELYVQIEAQAIERSMRQKARAAQAAGGIPADIDVDSPDFTDFNTEVSRSEMLRITLVDAYCQLRIILLPIVILASLAIARMLKGRSHPITGAA
jgi:hypothetical protein